VTGSPGPPVDRGARLFHYHGLTIAVRSDEPAHVAWLEEFLSPSFAVDDRGTPRCRVSLSIDARRYVDLLRRGPDPDGRSIPCFANDTNLVSLPLWTSPDAARVVFHRRSSVFLVARPELAEIEMIAARRTVAARPALMRVVRELAMMHVVQSGGLLIHGGAAAAGGRGFIVAGPKRSGKTTLLMHVLRAARIDFASNDRVVVAANGSAPTLRGLPTIVTIRHQTARRFSELSEFARVPVPYLRRLSETPPSRPETRRGGHLPVTMSPAQFCRAMGVNAIAEARLTALVFPRVTGKPGTLVVSPLDRAEAAERLRGGLFRSVAPVTVAPGLAVLGPPGDPPAPEVLCRALVDVVPAFDCALGRDAYARPEALAALVRDLTA
jgi:hypothetical protein